MLFQRCLVNFCLPLFHFVLRLQSLEGEEMLEMTCLIYLFPYLSSEYLECANSHISALFWKLWEDFEVCPGVSGTGLVSEKLHIRGTQVEGLPRIWKGTDTKQ